MTTNLQSSAGQTLRPPVRVSVVILARHGAAWVEQAVRSALGQTLNELEVIVVTDRADPAVRGALQALRDVRLTVLDLASPLPPEHALNAGVQEARGEWIALLDDRDLWLPDKLAKQLAWNRTPYADIISSRLIHRTARGDEVWPWRLYEGGTLLGDYLFDRKGLGAGEAILQWSTLLIRRSVLLAHPWPAVPRYPEWDWLLEAVEVHGRSITMHPDPLSVWRVSDTPSPSAEDSWTWLNTRRAVLSRGAQSGFLVLQIAPFYDVSHSAGTFWQLCRELQQVKAGSRRWFQFLTMWVLPQESRRRLRAHMPFFKMA
nr:glycosyltransferase family 2 protein [Deinococcus sp. Leaf326]